MTIGNLYDKCYENQKTEIVAMIKDREIKLTGDFYISDEITYYFTDHQDKSVIGDCIMYGIENESKDECWGCCGFGSRNMYEDVEVAIVDGSNYENDPCYFVDDIVELDDKVVIVCCNREM